MVSYDQVPLQDLVNPLRQGFLGPFALRTNLFFFFGIGPKLALQEAFSTVS